MVLGIIVSPLTYGVMVVQVFLQVSLGEFLELPLLRGQGGHD
jgi:hypothetical protein